MAKRLFDQVSVTLNGTDVSADVSGMRLFAGRRAPVDVTGLADTFDQFLVPNIRKWGVSMDYFNNFAGTSDTPIGIHTVLKQVFNSTATTGVALLVRATSAARSVLNPEFGGQVQLNGDFDLMQGAVAEADKGSVQLMGLGTLSFFTSSS